MPIKILVNGAFGRMGFMTVNMIENHPGFELVGQTGREYDLKKSIQDSGADVVVDFTHPDAVLNNTNIIIDSGARPVIGTTGLTTKQVKTLQEKCEKLKRGGVIAPNFSLGAVLMMKYAQQIANYLPNVEIIELHHDKKADSPSGTALRTAELIAEAADLKEAAPALRETVAGARGALYHGIPIHAVRLPGFLAHQQIIFGGTGETLTLRHDSLDRQCFMSGVAFACEHVMQLDHMVYGLEQMI